jgi:RNA polymerase sigma-70 factor (ECF subfamily)
MPRDDAAERRLVHAALVLGDRSAFEELFVRYWGLCYAYAAGMLRRGGADAEDLAQEAFFRIWERRNQFEAGRPFAPWLYAVAHNLWIDQVRRGKSCQPDAVGGGLDQLPSTANVAPTRFDLVYDIVATLSPEEFALFRMAFVDDRPVAVIAQTYGLTPQAINYRLRQIRKSLVDAGVLELPPDRGEANEHEPDHCEAAGEEEEQK